MLEGLSGKSVRSAFFVVYHPDGLLMALTVPKESHAAISVQLNRSRTEASFAGRIKKYLEMVQRFSFTFRREAGSPVKTPERKVEACLAIVCVTTVN